MAFRFLGTVLLVACLCFQGYQLFTDKATQTAHTASVNASFKLYQQHFGQDLTKLVPQLTPELVQKVHVGLYFSSALLLLSCNFLFFFGVLNAVVLSGVFASLNKKLDVTLVPVVAPYVALIGGLFLIYGSSSSSSAPKAPAQVSQTKKRQ